MLHDHHPLTMERLSRELVATVGVNGGILAWIHISEAYSWTMKLLQLLLLMATVAYTVFRAGTAWSDWQYARRRAKNASASKKTVQ